MVDGESTPRSQGQIRQCRNNGCRLRYPAPTDDPRGAHCPRCGSSTDIAAAISAPDEQHAVVKTAAQSVRRVEVILDNIRSIYNVGSIFRTADGAGIAHLHLCGITPTPDHPRLAKTSLGAEQVIRWSYHTNARDRLIQLRSHVARIYALEGHPDAISILQPLEIEAEDSILLVVGNERSGVDPGVLELCDASLFIPMRGLKRSLNVATAFGVAAYAVTGP